MNCLRITLIFVLSIFVTPQVVSAVPPGEPQARAWAEGFVHGYIQSKEPSSSVLCPINNQLAALNESLSYLRKASPVNFIVQKTERERDGFKVTIALATKQGEKYAWLYLQPAKEAFCVSDAFSSDQMSKIQSDTQRAAREQNSKKIFQP